MGLIGGEGLLGCLFRVGADEGLKGNAFKDSLRLGPLGLWANGRGLRAACCRCDARSLLRHGWGTMMNEMNFSPASKLAGPTAAASCTQSTGTLANP